MQTKKRSAQESAANMVLGIAVSQAVLWAYGMPIGKASAITVTMILLSFVRSYLVRRFFDRLDHGQEKDQKS